MKVYVILEKIFFEPFQEDTAFRAIKSTKEAAEQCYSEMCKKAVNDRLEAQSKVEGRRTTDEWEAEYAKMSFRESHYIIEFVI